MNCQALFLCVAALLFTACQPTTVRDEALKSLLNYWATAIPAPGSSEKLYASLAANESREYPTLQEAKFRAAFTAVRSMREFYDKYNEASHALPPPKYVGKQLDQSLFLDLPAGNYQTRGAIEIAALKQQEKFLSLQIIELDEQQAQIYSQIAKGNAGLAMNLSKAYRDSAQCRRLVFEKKLTEDSKEFKAAEGNLSRARTLFIESRDETARAAIRAFAATL